MSSLLHRIVKNPDQLNFQEYMMLGIFVLLALELVNCVVKHSGFWMKSQLIPVRGKHLDELQFKDLLFIGLNKLATVPFVYFLFQFLYHEPHVLWSLPQIHWTNVLLPIPTLFLLYDFFYTLLHWALHLPSIYGYIHKHHHHQKAPSRANVDAVNVHPIEFFLGEYNHLWVVWIYTQGFQRDLHVVTIPLFLLIGAILAGLNHTRFDVVLRVFHIPIYDSKYHDVHHRIPQSNYGQYIMFWDYIFHTFRDYNPKDRINPEQQLDFNTGKTVQPKNTPKRP